MNVLKSSKICRLALADVNTPYIVPVNYGYKDNALYVHSAKSGKKIDFLKKNPLVCFEVESDVQIIASENACDWSTRYKCVIGYGRAELLYDKETVEDALDIIMYHQSGHGGWSYAEKKELNKVTIIKITIRSLTGKRS